MVNYTKFPIRSTRHVSSPCDDGYIYIPVCISGRNVKEKRRKGKEMILLLLFITNQLFVLFLFKEKLLDEE